MTNKKYTNEDIISSLKIIATTRNCNECKIRNCEWGTCNCEQITANAALDLITCLQAENESLQAEIERLQNVIFKKEHTMQIIAKEKQEYFDKLQTAKAEAYKECIEKVRKLAVGMHPCSDEIRIFDSDFDNLVKEMVGENNDR